MRKSGEGRTDCRTIRGKEQGEFFPLCCGGAGQSGRSAGCGFGDYSSDQRDAVGSGSGEFCRKVDASRRRMTGKTRLCRVLGGSEAAGEKARLSVRLWSVQSLVEGRRCKVAKAGLFLKRLGVLSVEGILA